MRVGKGGELCRTRGDLRVLPPAAVQATGNADIEEQSPNDGQAATAAQTWVLFQSNGGRCAIHRVAVDLIVLIGLELTAAGSDKTGSVIARHYRTADPDDGIAAHRTHAIAEIVNRGRPIQHHANGAASALRDEAMG